MKISKRTTPLDMLSFEHRGHQVSVYTNRNVIRISVHKDGQSVRFDHVTPEQFIQLLTRSK